MGNNTGGGQRPRDVSRDVSTPNTGGGEQHGRNTGGGTEQDTGGGAGGAAEQNTGGGGRYTGTGRRNIGGGGYNTGGGASGCSVFVSGNSALVHGGMLRKGKGDSAAEGKIPQGGIPQGGIPQGGARYRQRGLAPLALSCACGAGAAEQEGGLIVVNLTITFHLLDHSSPTVTLRKACAGPEP